MSRISLITLPYAGAGANFFRSWQEHTRDLDVVALQLPGREELFVQPPLREVGLAVETLLASVDEQVDSGTPVAVFGHSLGAALAYELSRRLVEEGRVEVTRLAVSGAPAPWVRRAKLASELSDEAFVAQTEELAGYQHPALNHPELRELLLPALRADVEMDENYVSSRDRAPLPVPITAIRGQADELISSEAVAEWAQATSAGFRYVEIEGRHMYLCDDPEVMVRLLESELVVEGESRV